MAQYPQGIFQSLQYLLKKVKILALQKQPTYTGISTVSAEYIMPGRGIYEIINSSNDIVFPNPAFCNGQSITVINTNTLTDQPISATNQPYINGGDGLLPSIAAGTYYTFTSINGVWRGGQLYYPIL